MGPSGDSGGERLEQLMIGARSGVFPAPRPSRQRHLSGTGWSSL